MTLQFLNQFGATAQDPEQLLRYLGGTCVLSGLDVSVGSGTFGAADTISVAAGDGLVEATGISPGAADLSIPAATTYPRKDVVYAATDGNVYLAQGTEAQPKPDGATGFDTFDPAPRDLSGTTGAVLAEIWVSPSAAAITTDDIRDRRIVGRLPSEAVEALQNLGDDVFTGYPLAHGEDVDTPIDAHHARDHASRHHDGGPDEIDAAQLAGGLGDDDEYMGTDGEDAIWRQILHGQLGGVGTDNHHDEDHANRHHDGGDDELLVESLPTAGGTGSVPTTQGDGTLSMEAPDGEADSAFGKTDESLAFDESEADAVEHMDTAVVGGSVELYNGQSDTWSNDLGSTTPADSGEECGFVFETKSNEIEEIDATLGGSGNWTEARLIRQSDGTTVETEPLSGTANEAFTMTGASLSQNTEYRLVFVSNGNSANAGDDIPFSGTYVDVTTGWRGGELSNVMGFSAVDFSLGFPTSGTVTVAWPTPQKIQTWELATFQRTLDGETVTIDVLDESDNVLVSDTGRNEDISALATSENIKLRANLSRDDTSNNPTLGYVARRYSH